MFGIYVFLFSIVFTILFIKYGLKESTKTQIRREIEEQIFNEKDLPIKDEIKITKNFSIKLYGLKYKDEENQVFDRDDLTYLKLVQIINTPEKEYIKFNFTEGNNDGEFDIDVELVDFTLEENKLVYMDLMELVTNFNLAQFVFKNKTGELGFKLFDLDTEVVNKMKNHTDEIIAEIFPHIVERIINEGNSEMLKKAFDSKFNQ